MRRLLGILLLAAVVVAVLAYPAALLVDSAAGTDAVPLAQAADADTVEIQRLSFDDTLTGDARKAAVAEIYGSAGTTVPERFLFVPAERLIRPEEDPSMVLLRPAADGHDFQAKSLYFLAERLIAGALVAAAVLLLVRRFTSGGGS